MTDVTKDSVIWRDLRIAGQLQAVSQVENSWKHIAQQVRLDEHQQYLQLVAAQTIASAINFNGLVIAEALKHLADKTGDDKD